MNENERQRVHGCGSMCTTSPHPLQTREPGVVYQTGSPYQPNKPLTRTHSIYLLLALEFENGPYQQLEALARGEVERLVGEIDAANEAVKLAQDELLAAQVTLKHAQLKDNRRTFFTPPAHTQCVYIPPQPSPSRPHDCFMSETMLSSTEFPHLSSPRGRGFP